MPWFPHLATPAYLETLNLRRIILEKQRRSGRPSRAPIVEPATAEYISALAAGINAHHILQIGCGLSTVALAAGAKSTGSSVISLHTQPEKQEIVGEHLRLFGLLEYVQFLSGDIVDLVSQREGLDFVSLGGEAQLFIQIFDLLDLKPGAIVVADNALDDSTNEYIRHVRQQAGVDSSTLPVGRGLEITKIHHWEEFKKGRKRYEGELAKNPSRKVQDPGLSSGRHSGAPSESGGSLSSNHASVLSAEAWMASKAAAFLSGRGNSEDADEMEAHRHAAQELALSVTSSVSSIHAAEAWMASQAKAFYTDSGNEDEFPRLELEYERNRVSYVQDPAGDSDFDGEYSKSENPGIPLRMCAQQEIDACVQDDLATSIHGLIVDEPDFVDGEDAHTRSEQPKDHDLVALLEQDVEGGADVLGCTAESVPSVNGTVISKETEDDEYETDDYHLPMNGAAMVESDAYEDARSDHSDHGRVFDRHSSPDQSANGDVLHSTRGTSPAGGPGNEDVDDLSEPEKLLQQPDGLSENAGGSESHGTVDHDTDAAEVLSDARFEITFHNDDAYTEVTIRGVDQDMLLFDITGAFNETGVGVRRAKINTMGNYVEDTFHVVDTRSGAPLARVQWDTVKDRLLMKLCKQYGR